MNIHHKENKQTTPHILMVRPAHFGYNPETAESNAFQSEDKSISPIDIHFKSIEEFDALVRKLEENGIHVIVVKDTVQPVKPDAIFPNNWVTFHDNGTAITYPMFSYIRRQERNAEIIDRVAEEFELQATFNLESYEDKNLFLEGTGSMILDRKNKLVYACLSPRTDEQLLDHFCKLTRFKKMVFNAVDNHGKPIYHTNVMMALGETFVVICLETIKNRLEKEILIRSFQDSNKSIISISLDQMMSFAGNMLQVRNTNEDTFLVMSEQAYRSLNSEQIRQIERHTNILYSPIDTIEKFGGGSVRCMMAEIFLTLK